jgi:hypothetical protein
MSNATAARDSKLSAPQSWRSASGGDGRSRSYRIVRERQTGGTLTAIADRLTGEAVDGSRGVAKLREASMILGSDGDTGAPHLPDPYDDNGLYHIAFWLSPELARDGMNGVLMLRWAPVLHVSSRAARKLFQGVRLHDGGPGAGSRLAAPPGISSRGGLRVGAGPL